MIHSPINPSERVTFAHTVPGRVKSGRDLGPVNPSLAMKRIILLLGPGPAERSKLRDFLQNLQDGNSPDYHRWLTPGEFGSQFGPSAADVKQVTAWLKGQGFHVDGVARSHRWIEFSGAARQVEAAFETRIHKFEVQGKERIANATDISIPAALAPVVRGVVSLNDFFSRPMLALHYDVRRNAKGNLVPVNSQFTTYSSNPDHYIAPGDFATLYDLAPLYQSGLNGAGETIAVVARSNIELSDVEYFRQVFGLPSNDPNIILNGPDPLIVGNDSAETTLDAEWAGAVAPDATVDVVISASTVTTDGVDLSASYIVDHDTADVMDLSYGECEQDMGPTENAFYDALWQQAAAEGISVFVSAGDSGAAGCDDPSDPTSQPAQGGLAVNGLESTPYDTAVGGTQFNENGNDSYYWSATNGPTLTSVNGYIPEDVWNQSCDPTVANSPCAGGSYNLYAGGGGVSTLYAKPNWQSALNVPSDGQRDLPDVSLAASAAHDGYLMCLAGSCQFDSSTGQMVLYSATVVGGTSVSAPAMAGIMALIDQKFAARQGLANSHLYELASTENWTACNSTNLTGLTTPSSCIFYDVTAGNNSVPGQTGYNAGPGYDLATGLGTINAASLAAAWNSVGALQAATTTLSVGVSTIQHGQPVPVTVQVSAASGSGTPSGSFVLVSDKYGVVASGTLTSGSFTGTFSSLPGGQYNLTAHYQGDGVFGPSDSSSSPITVTPENSSISIAAYTYMSTGPALTTSEPYGHFLYFHATVSSASGNGNASGTVTFYDGGAQIGTITLDNDGQGELVSGGFSLLAAVTCLTVGTHSITASYSGSAGLNPSTTSQPLTITVTQATPSVPFSMSGPISLTTTQPLLVFNWVENAGPILPTGTLQYYDGTTAIGSPITIASGTPGSVPTASTSFTLAAGTHSITASYSGDSVYKAAVSQPLVVNVTAPGGVATKTTLTASPASTSLAIGDVVTYTVQVASSQTSPTPTGTVDLTDAEDGSLCRTQTLQSGSASFLVQWADAGPRILSAQYSGDSTYAASASSPSSLNVARGSVSVTLSSSASVVAPGKQVSLEASLAFDYQLDGQSCGVFSFTDDYPIQFYDALNGASPQPLGSIQYTNLGNYGSGTNSIVDAFTLPVVLPAGTNVVTADFLGAPDWAPATSSPLTVYVGTPTFAISTSTSSLTVNAGQSAGFGLTLTPQTGSGYDVELEPCVISPPATGISCSYAPATVSVGTAAATSAVTIQTTTATPAGTYTVTVPTSPAATIGSSTVQLTVKPAPLLFTASASLISPSTVTAGSTSNFTLSLSPQAGSGSGTVTLEPCTASPATTSITCNYSPASLTIGSSAVSSTVTIQTTSATPGGNYTVTIPTLPEAVGGNATVPLTVQGVSLVFSDSLSTPSPKSIAAGSSAAVTLTLTGAANSSSGSVAIQPCSVSPATTTITCSTTPNPVSVKPSSPSTATITISTEARGAVPPPLGPLSLPPPLIWSALLLAGTLLLALRRRRRSPHSRRRWSTALAFALLAAALLLEGACNGGGGGGGTPSPPGGTTGTPAGTYTVTIQTSPTATNGNASVQVSVQ